MNFYPMIKKLLEDQINLIFLMIDIILFQLLINKKRLKYKLIILYLVLNMFW